MNQWKTTIVILALAGSTLVSGCGNTPAPTPSSEDVAPSEVATTPTEAAETAAPKISKADAAAIAKLVKDAEGKVLVLNFWATWCPPCVAEMPDLVKFYEEMDKDQVAFVSLSADDPEGSEEVIGKFNEETGVTFPVYVLDTRAPDALHGALRTEVSGALPTTIIYNKQGKVVHVWERDTTQEELETTVKTLL